MFVGTFAVAPVMFDTDKVIYPVAVVEAFAPEITNGAPVPAVVDACTRTMSPEATPVTAQSTVAVDVALTDGLT